MKFRYSLLAFISAVILFVACRKDKEEHVPAAPQIISSGVAGDKDTVTVGETVVLHPVTGVKEGTSYSWAVNGTQVGTDSVYTFTGTDRGVYTILFNITNVSGSSSVTYTIVVYGKYENGFFIANEGWFGTEPSSVSFYRYGADTLELDIYKKENPTNNIGARASNLQYATIHNGRMYLVNKVGGSVIAVDAYTHKEIARSATGNWLALTAIDDTKGLVTSTTGVHPIDLNTMTIGTAIAGVTGSMGDILKAGNYVFAIRASGTGAGAVILNASDYSIVKTIKNVRMGFAQTPDGNVWCASSTGYVFKIDATTASYDSTLVTYTIPSNSPWQSTGITASTTENVVFIRSGKNIYKFPNTLNTPFCSIASDRQFYGKGIGYDPMSKQLVAMTIKGFGTNSAFNDLLFIDPVTAVLNKKISYEHIYFPAMAVFHQ
ncbi:MAG: DUF5074 domain-containing protein [Chitinophagaceae bacterium]